MVIMLKKVVIYLLVLAAFCMAFDSHGAPSKRDKLRKRTKQSKKVEKSAAIVWHKDLAKALDAAKKSKKNILLVHTAPGLSNNCKTFEKSILQSKSFTKYAGSLVLVKIEYTDLKKISKEAAAVAAKYPLARQGNKIIFPTVYMLDHTGRMTDVKFGLPKSSTNYLKSFRGYKKPKKK